MTGAMSLLVQFLSGVHRIGLYVFPLMSPRNHAALDRFIFQAVIIIGGTTIEGTLRDIIT